MIISPVRQGNEGSVKFGRIGTWGQKRDYDVAHVWIDRTENLIKLVSRELVIVSAKARRCDNEGSL